MIICAVSLCITMGVLRIYHYQPDRCQVPDWVSSLSVIKYTADRGISENVIDCRTNPYYPYIGGVHVDQ